MLWEARQGPWENGAFTGPGSGLFKSTDGGTTWRPLTKGLPTFADGLGRIGIAVAPSDPNRLYATVEVQGQEAGSTARTTPARAGTASNNDPRVANAPSDFAEVKVDPKNPDIVYTGSIVTWKSTDGGKTFTGFRGAPGGDDYHRIWINPDNPDIMLLAADQGAIITVNGGETLELLVQPADRAVLSRHHRQRVPVPRLRRPAGERIGLRRRAAATTGRSRSASGIRSASRSTATSRPTRSTRTSSTAAR